MGLAHVIGDAAGPQQRAGEPPGDRLLGRQRTDAGHPVEKDAVPGEEPVAVGEHAPHLPERGRRPHLHVGGEVLHDAAEPTVGDGEARPGERLDQIVEELAGLDHVEARRDGAELVGGHAEAGEVVTPASFSTASAKPTLFRIGEA